MFDPVLEAILKAKKGEKDVEPLSAEDKKALAEGHKALAHGDEVPDEDLTI